MIDIPNYNGKYKIDKSSNVYSKAKGRLLKPSKSVRGYMVLTLNKKTRPLHQLVVESFVDSNYKSKGLVVDHIDRNRANNKINNLRIVSQSENLENNDSKNYYYCKQRNKFTVQITRGGVRYGKRFSEEQDAIEYVRMITNKL